MPYLVIPPAPRSGKTERVKPRVPGRSFLASWWRSRLRQHPPHATLGPGGATHPEFETRQKVMGLCGVQADRQRLAGTHEAKGHTVLRDGDGSAERSGPKVGVNVPSMTDGLDDQSATPSN